jgi:hypothetical protein
LPLQLDIPGNLGIDLEVCPKGETNETVDETGEA